MKDRLTQLVFHFAEPSAEKITEALEMPADGFSVRMGDDGDGIRLFLCEYADSGAILFVEGTFSGNREMAQRLSHMLNSPIRIFEFHLSETDSRLEASNHALEVTPTEIVPLPVNEIDWDIEERTSGDLFERLDQVIEAELELSNLSMKRGIRFQLHLQPATGNPRLDQFIGYARRAEKLEVQKQFDGSMLVKLLLTDRTHIGSVFKPDELNVLCDFLPQLALLVIRDS